MVCLCLCGFTIRFLCEELELPALIIPVPSSQLGAEMTILGVGEDQREHGSVTLGHSSSVFVSSREHLKC